MSHLNSSLTGACCPAATDPGLHRERQLQPFDHRREWLSPRLSRQHCKPCLTQSLKKLCADKAMTAEAVKPALGLPVHVSIGQLEVSAVISSRALEASGHANDHE